MGASNCLRQLTWVTTCASLAAAASQRTLPSTAHDRRCPMRWGERAACYSSPTTGSWRLQPAQRLARPFKRGAWSTGAVSECREPKTRSNKVSRRRDQGTRLREHLASFSAPLGLIKDCRSLGFGPLAWDTSQHDAQHAPPHHIVCPSCCMHIHSAINKLPIALGKGTKGEHGSDTATMAQPA